MEVSVIWKNSINAEHAENSGLRDMAWSLHTLAVNRLLIQWRTNLSAEGIANAESVPQQSPELATVGSQPWVSETFAPRMSERVRQDAPRFWRPCPWARPPGELLRSSLAARAYLPGLSPVGRQPWASLGNAFSVRGLIRPREEFGRPDRRSRIRMPLWRRPSLRQSQCVDRSEAHRRADLGSAASNSSRNIALAANWFPRFLGTRNGASRLRLTHSTALSFATFSCSPRFRPATASLGISATCVKVCLARGR